MKNYKINNINQIISIVLLFLISFSNALYEDQVGKFDWRKIHIGKVNDASFDPNSNYDGFFCTEENVIASISSRTSEIKWRQIFEKSPRGSIKLFHVTNDDDLNYRETISSSSLKHLNHYNFDMLTVSGQLPAIVRGWSGVTGNLQFEWSIMPIQHDKSQDSLWYYENYHLYHILPIWNSHLEVTKYNVATGQTPSGHTTKISSKWIDKRKCLLANSYFVCLDKNQLISINLTDDEDETKIHTNTLEFEVNTKPKPLKGQNGFVVLNNKVVPLKSEAKTCSQFEGSTILYTKVQNQDVLIIGNVENNILNIIAINVLTCERIPELEGQIKYSELYGPPEIMAFKCYEKRQDEKICSMYITTEDGALIFIQQNKIKFVREESLSNVVGAELIDLPLSDAQGAIERQLNSKTGDITGAFVNRISSQLMQLKNFLLDVIDISIDRATGHNLLHREKQQKKFRDAFGLHKIIVLLTKTGKLFGIDNLSGEQLWIKYLPNFDNFNKYENMKIVIQRTSKHFPFESLCVIIGKDKETGNGILYKFNPLTGQPAENGGGLQKLNFKIKQFALLHENEDDFIRGLLLLDHMNNVHVIPKNSEDKAVGMFLYTADKDSAQLEGYNVHKRDEILKVLPVWKLKLSGLLNNHKITKIAAKNPNEHVHSQGRVLADRSVLYKYINPNLIAVVTQALDNIHKYVMNVHLIDVVSGSIVFSMMHKKVKGPIHIVHSENLLVYSYYNDKVRRFEMTTVELYEGKVQANNTVWSSLDAPPLPLVERQSYIFPSYIEAMKETITERGITNKHILIGLSNGATLEMPWIFLDPRRPVSNQAREEGIIPYIPELPIPTENIINYNQSIAKIKNIYTAPSGLESTCLVVVTGLDLYVTRVAPSKTFDLLKEDFDYFLISVVLLSLFFGSIIAKHLSSRKLLKQAWK